jgi:hypothetical protein
MGTFDPLSEPLTNYLVYSGESTRRQFVADLKEPAMALLWERIFEKVLEPAFMARFGDEDEKVSILFNEYLEVSILFLNYYNYSVIEKFKKLFLLVFAIVEADARNCAGCC